MPPKPKQFTRPPPKRKGAAASASAPVLQTEMDFLDAADEFEKSGGKWRAGDAAKAARFFRRAIEAYDAGLGKYSGSFDLAYNKAVLQYQLTQDKRIGSQFGKPVDLLQEAVTSHRFALNINRENADILFNTGQVLVTLAEELDDDRRDEAVVLVQEAIGLFSACLVRQEAEYAELEALKENATSPAQDNHGTETSGAMEMDASMRAETGVERPNQGTSEWATVLEPVTASTLLDTAVAQLGALTTLLQLERHEGLGAGITALATPLIEAKIPSYLDRISNVVEEKAMTPSVAALSISSSSQATFSRRVEASNKLVSARAEAAAAASLAVAAFESEQAEAAFRNLSIGAMDYARAVERCFETATGHARLGSGGSAEQLPFEVLAVYAGALMSFEAAVREKSEGAGMDAQETQQARGTALSRAAELLQQAGQVATDSEKVGNALAAGNCALLRWRWWLSQQATQEIAPTLVEEAVEHYRAAVRDARAGGATADELAEAVVKSQTSGRLLEAMTGGARRALGAVDAGSAAVAQAQAAAILREMVEDGLMEAGTAAAMAAEWQSGGGRET